MDPFAILFQDEHHLVVDKAPGLPCLAERHDAGAPCLLGLLRERFPAASLAHRIDRETSGLVLVALHPQALSHLSSQFEARTVAKEYLAWVGGAPAFEETTVDRPVGPLARQGETARRRIGKAALSVFRRERTWRGFARLSCRPHTGRTHQLRIHLADLGLPIVADLEHGGALPLLSAIKPGYVPSTRRAGREEPPLLKRLALHARRIAYLPFGAAERATREAALPEDLLDFERALDKYAGGGA